jgi:hypothetical protein
VRQYPADFHSLTVSPWIRKKGLDKEIGVMVIRLLLGRATKLFSSLENKNLILASLLRS